MCAEILGIETNRVMPSKFNRKLQYGAELSHDRCCNAKSVDLATFRSIKATQCPRLPSNFPDSSKRLKRKALSFHQVLESPKEPQPWRQISPPVAPSTLVSVEEVSADSLLPSPSDEQECKSRSLSKPLS